MAEYDTILKEKKKNEEPVIDKKKKKRFPWLMIDIFLILVLLVISYVVYYRTVLAPSNIISMDVSSVISQYKGIFKYFPVNDINSDFFGEGTFDLNDKEYNYGIVKSSNDIKIDVSVEDNYLLYYLEENGSYIKLSDKDYVSFEQQFFGVNLDNILDSFSSYITEDRYLKKFYFDGYVPMVEVDLVLTTDDVNRIFDISLNEDYEVLFTFKNTAFTNKIVSMKIVVNDINTNERKVVSFDNGVVRYSDDNGKDVKLVLGYKGEDFSLKIYNNDVLYSVLSGTKTEDSYQYMYQVIDKIYNISFWVTKEDNNYLGKLTSNIENNNEVIKREINITLNEKEDNVLEEDFNNVIAFDSLTKEEKDDFKLKLDVIIGDLRQLIDEYKQGI